MHPDHFASLSIRKRKNSLKSSTPSIVLWKLSYELRFIITKLLYEGFRSFSLKE